MQPFNKRFAEFSHQRRSIWSFLHSPIMSKPLKLDKRPRNKILQAISGKFSCDVDLHQLPPSSHLNEEINKWLSSSRRTKLSKWLIRHGFISDVVSKVNNLIKKEDFILSVRYNDIIRAADNTPHFGTCFNNKSFRGKQVLRFLADPDIAVVFVADKAGHHMWRAWVRLIFHPSGKGYGLLMYRHYGNANVYAIYEKLNSILPLFIQPHFSANVNARNRMWPEYYEGLYEARQHLQLLNCPTVHNNPICENHLWSDHKCTFDKNNKIEMLGIPWDGERYLYWHLNETTDPIYEKYLRSQTIGEIIT